MQRLQQGSPVAEKSIASCERDLPIQDPEEREPMTQEALHRAMDSFQSNQQKVLQRMQRMASAAEKGEWPSLVPRLSRELSPQSLGSISVVEESVSPSSCKIVSLDSKSRNSILPTVEDSKDYVEVLGLEKMRFLYSEVTTVLMYLIRSCR